MIEVVHSDLASAEVCIRHPSRIKLNLPPSVYSHSDWTVMNPALKLPFTPALTHLAENSSGYHKISDAKAHLVSINCWIIFFFCRSGHDLNPSTHSILACLSEGCGSSRPPSASQISAEVLQSRLR